MVHSRPSGRTRCLVSTAPSRELRGSPPCQLSPPRLQTTPRPPPPPPPQQQRAVVEGPTAALELGDDRLGIDAGGRRGVLEAAPLAQQLHLWVKQLSYFLMHFPGDSDYDGGGIEPLRRLERSLCIRNHAQK